MKSSSEFPALSQYTESIHSNETWVNVTVTRTDSDGNKSQVSAIVPQALVIINGRRKQESFCLKN